MPAPDEHPATGESDLTAGPELLAGQPSGQLRVHPFRGVRYDPARVSDLAAVTSPPYDVIDADSAAHLEELDPHNVVRLILPRPGVDGAGGGYDDAAARLAAWLADGTLQRDAQPAIYVYEQVVGGFLQRGILAAVELRDPADRVVLPHEDVMPGPVADRLELMRATGANLEPILLVYQGGGGTAAVITSAAADQPLIETTTEDGIVQRVWRVTDPALHERISEDLAPRQALIADGHHRYATYRRLQAEKRAAGGQAGPWDSGLALLVDSVTYPLRLQAIHRVVEGLSPARPSRRPARCSASRRRTATSTPRWLRCTRRHARTPSCSPTGRPSGCSASPTNGCSRRPARRAVCALAVLDASVLDAVLLEQLWSVDPSSVAGALCPRRRRRPASSDPQRGDRGAAQAGRRGRCAGRRGARRTDAAQVDVVRPEATHRAGPAAARRGCLTPSRGYRGLPRAANPSGASPAGPPRAAHLHLAAAGRPVRRLPEPSAQRAPHLHDVAGGSHARNRRCADLVHAAQSIVSTVATGGRRRAAAPLPRHDQAEGHHDVAAGQLSRLRLGGQPPHQVHLVGVLDRHCSATVIAARLLACPELRRRPPGVTRLARVDRADRGRRPPAICGQRVSRRTPVDDGQSSLASAPSSASRNVTPESSATRTSASVSPSLSAAAA